MKSRFITFEGIDGAGKSSQIAAAVALIESRGIQVVQTREPGGTPLGEKLREILLHEPMHLETEAMLMFAARRLAGTGQAPDRFEREKADFFQRVRAAYLRRAAAAPQRVRLIDASRKPDEIRAEVEAIIAGACFQ